MGRYLEICDGVAFHETEGPWVPPAEVLYCDCRGVGRETFNPQNVSQDDKGNLSESEWRDIHSGETCKVRRQIFVDVTDRPTAKLGMSYRESTDTFYTPAKGKK